MHRNCDLVMDLLPLYAENLASRSSRELVEEHIVACENCAQELRYMEKELLLPQFTDISSFKQIKNNGRIKSLALVLAVLCAIGLILSAYWTLSNVQVWLTAEEAVTGVTVADDGTLEIHLTEKVGGSYSAGNGVLFSSRRIPARRLPDWMNDREPVPYTVSLYDEESFWYPGSLVGGENVLLYGQGDFSLTPWDEIHWTMAYLFWGGLAAGAMLLFTAWLFRRKKSFGVLWRFGILPLLFSGASLFVTNGRFLVLDFGFGWHYSGGLWIRIAASVVMAVTAWGLLISLFCLVKR
ncbi:MAG: zf-HC2 domain-containing protein, partial [Oscillospiraceae bacterium]|nr:zf-HC2 domain-containing protein [Oscillospiraceae bacterium]